MKFEQSPAATNGRAIRPTVTIALKSLFRLRTIPFALLLVFVIASWPRLAHMRPVRADSTAPRLYLGSARRFPAAYTGSARAVKASNQANPVSLAADDFDVDGVNDLAVGLSAPNGGMIAIHRGNLDAYAPQSHAGFLAIGRGEFPSPYLQQAQLIEIPGRPDFLVSGDVIGQHGPGLVAATRGGNALYVVARGESGSMELVQTVSVPGAITAAGAHLMRAGKYDHVAVGIHGASGPQLLLFAGSNDGLTLESTFPLAHDADAFAFGNLDGDPIADILTLAGGQISILHGGSKTLEPVSVSYSVTSIALGRFLFDRSNLLQMALLSSDGTLHFLGREGLDSRPLTVVERGALRRQRHDSTVTAPTQQNVAWKEVDSISDIGTPDSSGQPPRMFRTRISDNGADDVMVLSAQRLTVVTHPDSKPSAAQRIDRFDLAADAVAALPARVNVDGRPGVTFVARGDVAPQTMMPLPDPTFTVNTTNDGVHAGACAANTANECTLREAILEANAASGTDTIMIPAGTYTLTLPKVPHDFTGQHGTLEVKDSVNIIGAGTGTTIVQAGTTAANGVDKVFSFNQDITSSICSPNNPPAGSSGDLCAGDTVTNATVSISNFTIQNGFNRGDIEGDEDGYGGAFDFDTGSSGTATLTITNMNLASNTAGEGSAFQAFNFSSGATQNDPTGPPTVIISNSIVQSNTAFYSDPTGDSDTGPFSQGAITTDVDSRLLMTNCEVINNTATQQVEGEGAGLFLSGNAGSTLNKVHSSVISGNTVSEAGGGVFNDGSSLVIDTGTVISNNTDTSTVFGGAGLDTSTASPDTVSVTSVSFTGNHSTFSGGAVQVDGSSSTILKFCRFFNNSAASGSNVYNDNGSLTVNDNWWATNTLSTIQGTVTTNGTGSTAAITSFLELLVTASPTTVTVGGSDTSTVTASFLKDSNGTAIAASNLAALAGVGISFGSAVDGSLSAAQPVIGGVNISSVSESGTTVTVTTSTAESFSTSQTVYLSNVGSGYDGAYTIATTPTGTTFTFTSAASELPTLGAGGTAAESTGTATATFTGTSIGVGSVKATVDGFTATSGNIIVNSDTTTAASNQIATFNSANQNVTLSATVTASSGNSIGAGTVTFSVFNGGTQFGSAVTSGTVSSGSASATFVLPGGTAAGTYSIHASYSGTSTGSGDFLASTDTTHTLTVSAASTTTAASNQTASFNPSSQSVTLSATVTSGAGTVNAGTVTFTVLNGGTPVGTATTSGTVSGGSASVSYTLPAGTAIGTYTIQAVYNGSTDFSGSSDSSHTLTISAATTTAASNATTAYSASNQSVTLSAAVTSAAGTVNAGTVTFGVFNGGTQIGTSVTSGTVTNGSASATYTLPGGTNAATYSIHATYNAAGGFNSSSDSSHTLTVSPATTTTAASNQTANFSASAQSVTLSATVTSGAGTVNAGTVTFTVLNGSTPVGTATTSGALTTGSASVSYTLPASTPAGTYTIQAVYNGSTNFAGSSDSSHTLTISGGATTTAASNASATYSASSQGVTLSATVTSGAGTVNAGTVTFSVFNGGTQIGTSVTSGTVTNGSASASYTLPGGTSAGTYTITANYNGAGGFNSSSDNSHTLTVTAASTTTAASNQTASFSASAQSVTLSATVTSTAGTVNAGTVTFTVLNGSTPVGSATTSAALTAGSASVSYTLPAGTPATTYTIQAVYSGSTNFSGSSDSSHTLTISSGGTTTTASNALATYSPSSQLVTLAATVTSGSGTVNAGTVTFTVLSGSTPVGSPVTSGTVTGGTASASYTLPGGTPAAIYTIQASYSGGGGFPASSDSSHTLTVMMATPVVTWATPASLTYGGALTSTQLNATANVPGTFVYTPPAGTVLSVGNNQTLSVLFTPTDTVDYTSATQTVQISVLPFTGPASLLETATFARDSSTNDVIMTLNITNTGGSAATSVQVNAATLAGVATITSLPLVVGTVGPSSTATVTLTFPASVGTSGTRTVVSYSGTYSGGSFGGSGRVVLP